MLAEQPVKAATRSETQLDSTERGGQRKKDERRSAASHRTHTATQLSCVQEGSLFTTLTRQVACQRPSQINSQIKYH